MISRTDALAEADTIMLSVVLHAMDDEHRGKLIWRAFDELSGRGLRVVVELMIDCERREGLLRPTL